MSKNKDLKLFFSLVSGEVYEVNEDEVKNLDDSQIPLLKRPKENCRRCYGRFYESRHYRFNRTVGAKGEWIKDYYTPCRKCSPDCIDWKKMKSHIDVAMPRTLTEAADDDFAKAVEKEIPVTTTSTTETPKSKTESVTVKDTLE